MKKTALLKNGASIREIVLYQIFSKMIFICVMELYRNLCGLILWNIDRPAFTSGDLPFILRTWQGWLLVVLGFFLLVLYTCFDINAMILMSDQVLHGEKVRVLSVLKTALQRRKRFRSLAGVLLILYVSLAAPLTGLAFGITLTENFTVPEFIMSVINDVFILRLLYAAAILGLLFLGIRYFFSFHFIILEDMDARDALKMASGMMKANLKSFLKELLLILLKGLLLFAATVAVVYYLPILLMELPKLGTTAHRTGIVFFTLLLLIALWVFEIAFSYYKMLKVTALYRTYAGQTLPEAVRAKKKRKVYPAILACVCAALLLGVSALLAENFDSVFPADIGTYLIAHRCGGNLANENTLVGVEAAIEWDARACELDVQRTADGHYIINHDNDFLRCCGVDKTPGEMTLAEIRQLRVKDSINPFNPPTEVATMEEMLDAAKDRIELYIEFKGEGMDKKMVDDVYRMVRERNMQQQVTFICLDYGIVEYADQTYPDVKTGYLCFFSFGDIEDMKCDKLLLEAETATPENIAKVHAAGKEVNVWTVNSLALMVRVFADGADGIISDEVALASILRLLFRDRGDELRVFLRIF